MEFPIQILALKATILWTIQVYFEIEEVESTKESDVHEKLVTHKFIRYVKKLLFLTVEATREISLVWKLA